MSDSEPLSEVVVLADQAVAYQNRRQWQKAAETYLRALHLAPLEPELFFNLGDVLVQLHKQSEAMEAYQRALELDPNYLQAYQNLGQLLSDAGRLTAALKTFEKALAIQPDSAPLYVSVAHAFFDHQDAARAFKACQEALRCDPSYAPAYAQLAQVLTQADELEAARQCLEEALRLAPEDALYWGLKGHVCLSQGDGETARQALDTALLYPPQTVYAEILMNRFFCLRNQYGLSLKERLQAFQGWAEKAGFQPFPPREWPASLKVAERRLRVGYVSGDLGQHSAAITSELLFLHHQRSEFEIFVYTNSRQRDGDTTRIKDLVLNAASPGHWREIADCPAEQIFQQIQADQIDLLVDMNGYSKKNALGVFALRPAPVQITGLGYGDSTGLSCIDYLFADSEIFPPEAAEFLAESLLYLPEFMHWEPPLGDEASIAALAERPDGPLVMGSGNSLFKLNPELLVCWQAILAALPEAELQLKNPQFEDAGTRERFRSRLERLGFDCLRVKLLGRSSQAEHQRFYAGLDLVLDPFPYNGGVSNFEALWMSRPFISLRGPMGSGASMLNALGCPELIAESTEEYIAKAVALGQDRSRLKAYHSSLRAQLKASPLCDGPRFVRLVEQGYRQAWRAFCQGQKLPSPTHLTLPL